MNARLLPIFGLLLLLIACTPPAPSSNTGSSAPPARPRPDPAFKLNIGLTLMPANMDPHASIGLVQTRFGVYESLVALDDDSKTVPALATEWKVVNPTTWQFKLAQGRKFSDGNPVTAEDVKFSLERSTQTALNLATAARTTTFDRVEIVDPQTINLITKKPDPLLLKRVIVVSILEKAHVEKITKEDFALKGLGTGPYMQKEFVAQDKLVLVPNPHHPQQPVASEVTLRQIVEASARIAGLRTGEIDLADAIPVDQADQLKSAGIQLVSFEGNTLGSFLFNTNENQAINNKLVRQALNYAVDKETIAKTIFKGYTKPSAQVIPASVYGFNPSLKPYPFDPAKAKQLLAQAGYPNGLKMKMDNVLSGPENKAALVAVQQYFKDVGVELDLFNTTDVAYFLDRYFGRAPRAEMLATVLAPVIDVEFALALFNPQDALPLRRYQNAEFDQTLQAAGAEMNEARRLEQLNKALAIMYEDPPFLYLVESFNLWGASSRLQNIKQRVDGEPRVPGFSLK